MQRWDAYRQLVFARLKEFYREPEAVFWVFGFPIVLAFALGLAFRNTGPGKLQIGVAPGPGDSALAATLFASAYCMAIAGESRRPPRVTAPVLRAGYGLLLVLRILAGFALPMALWLEAAAELRARFGGRPTFRELLRHVRETTLDAFAHASVPFDMLVEGNENGNWLGGRDSNPDNMLQRHASYRWTTSQLGKL